MMILVALFLSTSDGHRDIPLTCGHKEIRKREYGAVELRVSCEYLEMGGMASALEYKGSVQHGIAIHYDSSWRKRDSSFFVNGKENGLCLYWDTLGNIVGKETYKNGHFVGKRESYFAPGRPAQIRNYNAAGKEDGSWQEWWWNGNKKAELEAKNGRIIAGTEYYPDGKVRGKYRTKYDPKNLNVFRKKHIEAEAWTPKGKSTGKIVNGNGEWTHFSAEPNPETGQYNVYREVYKDSLMIKGEKLDSAEIAEWLR